MKNIKKYILGSCVGMFALTSLTGCVEETFPESSTVTEEQVQKNPASAEGFLLGLPSYFNTWWAQSRNRHNTFGYAALMHVRDHYTQDLCMGGDIGYSWWDVYSQNKYQGDGYIYGQFPWNFYYGFIKIANDILGSIPEDPAACTEEQNGYRGVAMAFRAMLYLDMARMYEYLPTDGTSPIDESTGNDVTGLTLPIVKNGTSIDVACNNPRAPHAEMAAFIESDLMGALEYIDLLPAKHVAKTLPNKACVYGLLARLYMWNEDYAKARQYARLAIDESGIQPMDETAWLDVKTGFNDINKWMWGVVQTSETDVVKSGIVNWSSWVSNQTTFGYTGLATGMFVVMDKQMYERISDTDFRKLAWVAPKGSALDGLNDFPPAFGTKEKAAYVDYASLKFRPNQGNIDDYTVGAASSYPIMRVEEMYMIEAEAAAHVSAAEGITLINNFMQTYRDPNYSCDVTSADRVIEEIVFQKRVELWGEGHTFFDIKRLNYSVTRGYPGTNHPELDRLNTNGRPAWMNLVMVQTEQNNNPAVLGWNNPDPSDCYKPWVEEE